MLNIFSTLLLLVTIKGTWGEVKLLIAAKCRILSTVSVVLQFHLQTCNLIQSNLIPRKSSVSASTKKANVFRWTRQEVNLRGSSFYTVSTRGTFGLFFQQPCHVSLNIASMDLVSVKLFLSFHYFLLCIWIIWEKFSCFHVLKQQYHVMHKI